MPEPKGKNITAETQSSRRKPWAEKQNTEDAEKFGRTQRKAGDRELESRDLLWKNDALWKKRRFAV